MNARTTASLSEVTWVEVCEPEEGRRFAALTFAAYRGDLEAFDAERSLAVGVLVAGRPAGLALFDLSEKRVAHLRSIFVAKEYRCRGLGAELLSRSERLVTAKGLREMEISYRSGREATPALEALLAHEGWQEPRVRQIYCRTTGWKMQEAGWTRRMKLPAEYEMIAWSEVTEEDRLSLRARQAEQPFFPESLDPLRHEIGYEPVNSLALRYRGEIVGWLITHSLGGNCIRYTCSYLRPDLQCMARLVALYGEGMRRQIAQMGPDCSGVWTVPVDIPRMAAFARRRFAPFLLDFAEFRFSRKSLECIVPGP